MFWVQADLHIHSALSPCADEAMTPQRIVEEAAQADLDIIALCDHNSAGNAAAVQAASQAQGLDLVVLAGMEITTREEAHILGLFPSARNAESAARQVRATLPYTVDNPRLYGHQWLYAPSGERVGEERRMLSAATALSLNATVQLIHQHQGLAIAAHIDRPAFSVTSQLGFIPEETHFDALELSAHAARDHAADFEGRYPQTLIASSDAHFPQDIGIGRCLLLLDARNLGEIARALRQQEGRACALA